MLNARHRSAHEHLGEAYLVLGEPAKAQHLLAALENLCLLPCEEYDDLKRAIAAYKKAGHALRSEAKESPQAFHYKANSTWSSARRGKPRRFGRNAPYVDCCRA